MTGTNKTFDDAATWVAQSTKLSLTLARGSMRLALKKAGLDARHVTGQQLATVFRKIMPATLCAQGLARAKVEETCEDIARRLGGESFSVADVSAAEMLERLDRARRMVR